MFKPKKISISCQCPFKVVINPDIYPRLGRQRHVLEKYKKNSLSGSVCASDDGSWKGEGGDFGGVNVITFHELIVALLYMNQLSLEMRRKKYGMSCNFCFL
jgi:hypothetical protein